MIQPARLREPSREHALPNQFGKYQLLGRLATGGMAEIHLARAVGIAGFEKLVVVKRILPSLTADPDFVRMFLDEARLAATLQHPNIVQVFDIGKIGDDYFFAMEFLHGEDTAHLMWRLFTKRRELPLELAIHIMVGVCAGLNHAHEQRGFDGSPLHIVHRDVSPSNVLVTYDGGIKLMDFGVAKASHQAAQTRHGMLKGKLRYMSPEQARSLPLDRRSDVFSAAVMLWELTTGRRMFGRQSDFEVLKATVERDAPRPSSVKAEYPRALERIVRKGLERDPARRYQTAQELQAELEEFARERKLAVSPIALSNFMRELFADELAAWEAARLDAAALTAHLIQARDAVSSENAWLAGEEVRPARRLTSATPLPAAFDFARWSVPAAAPKRSWNLRRSVMAGAGALVAASIAIFALPERSAPETPAVALMPAPTRPPPAEPPVIVQMPLEREFPPAPKPPRRHHRSTRAPTKPAVDVGLPVPIDYDAPLSP